MKKETKSEVDSGGGQMERERTLKELRIRVAELCGWHDWRGIDDPSERIDIFGDVLPDYCNDLNAMHEAEETLSEEQWPLYFEALAIIQGVPAGTMDDITPSEAFNLIHATAEQRCKAFVVIRGASSVPGGNEVR